MNYCKQIESSSSWYQPDNELMTDKCAIFFFGKNCANTETHSFADMYAIRISDEGNNHSSPALVKVALVPCKHQFPLVTSTESLSQKKKLEILTYPQKFSYAGYEISANFCRHETRQKQNKLSTLKDCVSLTFIKSKIK